MSNQFTAIGFAVLGMVLIAAGGGIMVVTDMTSGLGVTALGMICVIAAFLTAARPTNMGRTRY